MKVYGDEGGFLLYTCVLTLLREADGSSRLGKWFLGDGVGMVERRERMC